MGLEDDQYVFLLRTANPFFRALSNLCLFPLKPGVSVLHFCFFPQEVGATIFSAKNIKISNDRLGLTRSAILLVLFIVIHAVGNLHVFKGACFSIFFLLKVGDFWDAKGTEPLGYLLYYPLYNRERFGGNNPFDHQIS